MKDFRKTGKYTNFLSHLKKGTPLEKEIVGYIELLESQIMERELTLMNLELTLERISQELERMRGNCKNLEDDWR